MRLSRLKLHIKFYKLGFSVVDILKSLRKNKFSYIGLKKIQGKI